MIEFKQKYEATLKKSYDCSTLRWILCGYTPFQWRLNPFEDIRNIPAPDVPPIPVKVPGSVQFALFSAGVIPDWNQGLHARECEWVENRHWIFQAEIPDEWLQAGKQVRLRCLGLDERGWILVNGSPVAGFENAFLPHVFDLTPFLSPSRNLLQIAFDTPPRWLGQFGYTSRMTEWKPRYNYTWDWTSRLVQIGVWDAITIEIVDGFEIESLKIITQANPETNTGSLRIAGMINTLPGWKVRINLAGPGDWMLEETVAYTQFSRLGFSWNNLPILLWQPNGLGSQPLYQLTVQLLDQAGFLIDEQQTRVGFKKVEWLPCQDAPPDADPWICSINGQPVFLQGFNWTPIRPNFADVPDDQYRHLLELYRDLGVNILRVWGGAFLEKEIFYNLCDEYGLMVWQEFPLSSSGLDNWPPEDEKSILAMSEVARSYIARRNQHVSLLCWCGGNELQGNLKGEKTGGGKPVDLSHPLIGKLGEIVREQDPDRRYLASSSSGPRFFAAPEDFGKGLHWDVHGPWKLPSSMSDWADYWGKVDALFHSEVGAPGGSSAEIVRNYSGGLPVMPASSVNPLWRRTSWWIEWPEFASETGHEPSNLEEFIQWSQTRQSEALMIVANSLKSKFPRCGGVIFWMGHDSFPCTSNTSVIDFDGNLKPVALALKSIFKRKIP